VSPASFMFFESSETLIETSMPACACCLSDGGPRVRIAKKFRRIFREHIAPVAVTVLLLCSFRSAVADWNIVPSGSMNPNIVEGDRIFVKKLAYGLKVPFTTYHLAHWSGPQSGEIVVFYSPAYGTRLVKRC